MHSRTIYPKTKLMRIENLKIFQVFVEMMIHSFVKILLKLKRTGTRTTTNKTPLDKKRYSTFKKEKNEKEEIKEREKLKDMSRSGTTNKPGQE